MPQHYEDNGGNGVELEDMRSVYSSVRPASTILNGFPHNRGPFATPPAGSPYGGPGQNQARLSGMPQNASQSRLSLPASQYLDAGNAQRGSRVASSVLGGPSRPASTVNGMRYSTVGMPRGGPDDGAIIEAIQSCLADVDLDTVTKKQVRALVEQRLQTTLVGERKQFLDRQIDVELANL
ncbi:hypothetical protein KEM55_003222 [Ascosphaera atra]|nr:hypothetical protein KEM55_003222 [Ascosphaera atra]